jgi:ribosomal protein S18 acetylase RimI-like enzyme
MPTLRPYRADDWDDFIALDIETGLAGLRDAAPEVCERFRQRWPDVLKKRYQWTDSGPSTEASRLIVCEGDDGRYAGHLWLNEQTDFFTDERQLFITSVAVKATHRQQGLGKLLMQTAIDEARRLGIARVALGVDAANTAAVSLYAGLGFQTQRLSMLLQLDGADQDA